MAVFFYSHELEIMTFFKKEFIYFLERRGGKEKEKERNTMCGRYIERLPPPCAPSGDLACNPGMCPDPESNPLHFSSQGGAQSTEPHQPEQMVTFLGRYILIVI